MKDSIPAVASSTASSRRAFVLFPRNYDLGMVGESVGGLVDVSVDTLERTVKESGRWYSRVAETNGFD